MERKEIRTANEKLTKAGAYPNVRSIHPGVSGTVVVQ
jgi:hypothetical protein